MRGRAVSGRSSSTTSAPITGKLSEFDLDFEDSNPFCGDEQHVFIKLGDDNRVAEVSFEGQGCAISTAATSLLTDELVGKSRDELLTLPKIRARPARDRDLGDAAEVRAAGPEGGQGRNMGTAADWEDEGEQGDPAEGLNGLKPGGLRADITAGANRSRLGQSSRRKALGDWPVKSTKAGAHHGPANGSRRQA